MKGDRLPAGDQIVRHVPPSRMTENGKVDDSAFYLRPYEAGLSVNWLECPRELVVPDPLAEIIRCFRLQLKPSHCFAELNVGEVLDRLISELEIDEFEGEFLELEIIHEPLEAEGDYEADPSHSEIRGLPLANPYLMELAAETIAQCVRNLHGVKKYLFADE